MTKLILFGAGIRGRNILQKLMEYGMKPTFFTDNDPAKWNTVYHGIPVVSPGEILKLKDIKIVISAVKSEEIKNQLFHMGISEQNIMSDLELNLYLTKRENKFFDYIEKYSDFSENWSVLFDCENGLILGGIETWTFMIGNALLAHGLPVKLISCRTQDEAPGLLKTNVEMIDFTNSHHFLKSDMQKVIEVIMRNMPCNVITSQVNEIMLAAYVIKQYFPNKLNIISVIHGGADIVYDRYLTVKDCVDLFVGVSLDIQEAMIQRGIDSSKVLHMTIPVPCETVIDKEYSPAKEPLRIAYGGRLEKEQKRVELLFPLIEKLELKKVNYVLNIVGKGSYENAIRDFITLNDLSGRVNYLGCLERDQMVEFWRSNDIFINVSDFEGNSLSMMEAMANGLVPVVTRVSGTKENIKNGYNGYIVDLEDIDVMAEQIAYLDLNREIIKQFGDRSHEIICKKCSMKDHLAFMESLLKK